MLAIDMRLIVSFSRKIILSLVSGKDQHPHGRLLPIPAPPPVQRPKKPTAGAETAAMSALVDRALWRYSF